MIELNEVKVRFDGLTVLDVPFLEFKDGCSYLIKGESGTGKTTLFNVISDLKLTDECNVFLDKTPVNTASNGAKEEARVVLYVDKIE